MKPGIETEVVYDKAESGLYHYENIGKTGGAYTSLSNALLDANSEDAAAWDAEKDKTKKRLIAGATVAGVGAVGGFVGDKLIDKKYDKKIAKIEEKFSTTNEVQEIAEVEEAEEAKAQAEAEEQARKEAEEQTKKEAEEQAKENDDAQKAMAEQNQETITPIRLTPQPIQTLSVPSATDDIALNKKLDQDLKENKKALREYQRKSKRDMKNQTFPEDETKQETPIPSGPSPKLTDQNSLIKPVVTLPTEEIKLTAATAGINLDASVAQASNKQPENDTAPANLRMDAQKSTDMQLSVPSAQPKDKEVSKQVKKTLNDNKKNDQNKRNHKNKDTKPTETNQETPIPSGPSPKLTDQNSLVKPVATLPTEQTKPTAAKASVETDAKKTATAAPSDNSVVKGNTDTKTKNNTETKPATTKAPYSTADKSKTTQQKTTTNSGTGDTDNTPKKSASAEYINIQTCQKANPYDSIKCVIKETGMVGAVSLSPTATKKLSFTQDGRANWRDMASAWAELGTGATLTKTPTGMVAKYDASKGDTLKCSFNYRSESDWFRCTNTSVNQTTNNTNKKVSKDEKTCVDSGGTWELNKWGVKMECVCDRKKGMVSVPALNKCICYGDENKYDPKRHLCINTKTKKPVSN
ncbi:MAG: hypothetical protein K5912_02565, partial [Alphaproteobacteria bacterium]|nr:hypothetical protein [Alphaproteobacteria bacterium]